MATFRSDDPLWRARLVYLGPPSYTLPVHLPYGQYGLFCVVCPAFMIAAWTLAGWKGSGIAIAAAVFATWRIWGYVDPDQPARKLIRVWATDWRPIRTRQHQAVRRSARHIRFQRPPRHVRQAQLTQRGSQP